MAKTGYELFKITCLTNMHVGSGDTNFGVVDKLVQRDVTTGVPFIRSPSLKGALREFFEGQDDMDSDMIKFVFGSPPGESGDSGSYKFFSAHLLSIPVRSNKKPFFRAVSPHQLGEFLENMDLFGIKLNQASETIKGLIAINPTEESPIIFEDLGSDVFIEDFKAECRHNAGISGLSNIEDLIGKDIALFHDDTFKGICSDLPVVARNHLENGQSQNLWYEEVVPRQSIFYFVLGAPEDDPNGYYPSFLKILDGNLVQIGANATIGYGFTKIEKVSQDGGDEDEEAR